MIARAVSVDTIGRDNEIISKEIRKTTETKTQIIIQTSVTLRAKSCHYAQRKVRKQNYVIDSFQNELEH